ncbi:ribosome silencing factor [Tautonia sociabilis]|uniref:Ribosomal silencing factor RsfS n=1 Tax=Tautonia sociabilis TaxID=2080755 RepID=A0A432MGG0_9BACT|nr:ribosome silencing factor [Tautonia sociabilis]RUL85732.1 ribosome silencing factor [Tautonia sociabilis]
MPDANPTQPDDRFPEQPEGKIPLLPRRARVHDVQDDVPPAAVTRSSPERQARALQLARQCARIAEENRAREIELLDLRQSTPLFDYFVVLTAPSRRQANAIVSEIDHEMKRLDERKLGIEGSEEGRWTLIDYGDFVVHVFSDEARAFYALEDIWGDAPRLDWKDDASPASPAADADPGSGPAGEPS